MEKVVASKRRGNPGKRWMLNVKVSDAIYYWRNVGDHEIATAVTEAKTSKQRKKLLEAGFDSVGPISSLVSEQAVRSELYATVHAKRWEDRKLPVYISTGWVENTGHDVSDTSLTELKGILEYLKEAHPLDWAQFTLIQEEDGAIRSTKWQGHLVEEEVAVLEEAVVSLL